MSKLIPNTMLEIIPNLYKTQEEANPICHVKLFTPDSSWSWYIIELSQDKNTCFGYAVGHEAELGYFTLSEIEKIKGPLGLLVERDIHFIPTHLETIKQGLI